MTTSHPPNPPVMNALAQEIAARITASGPLTLADYMGECLLHPRLGYYTTRPPFGAEGDFITAPEISQMFGELIGLVLAQAWLDQGAPQRFTLAELGPGRGTLMADVLRATRAVPGFHQAAELLLIEASPRLRALQAERLADYSPRWQEDLTTLPDQPLFLIANEFFDALPIRQFHFDGQDWHEMMVGLQHGALALGLSPACVAPALPAFDAPEAGRIVEVCPAAAQVVQSLSHPIAKHGGAALIIDYGDWRSSGDTFQALRAHRFADPLHAPGEADLTAHVDFEALAQASPLRADYTTQGAFLSSLGIAARTAKLAQGLNGAARDSHLAAYRRLTAPEEMGSLFKVLGLTAPHTPLLAGFAPHHDA